MTVLFLDKDCFPRALPVLPIIAELKLRKARFSEHCYRRSLITESRVGLFATERPPKSEQQVLEANNDMIKTEIEEEKQEQEKNLSKNLHILGEEYEEEISEQSEEEAEGEQIEEEAEEKDSRFESSEVSVGSCLE